MTSMTGMLGTIDSAYMTGIYTYGTCTTTCTLCGTTGKCPFEKDSPELAKYDFTVTGGPWTATQSDSMGNMPSFTIS